MTHAWNQKEEQLCEGTDGEVCEDLNGDGHIGNTPPSGDCDGETNVLEKLWDAAVDFFFGDSETDNDDEDNSEADECFPKPWNDYYNFGTGFATFGQHNFMQDSMFAATGNFF